MWPHIDPDYTLSDKEKAMIDVNNAKPQQEIGEVLPDGTFVRLNFHINPQGVSLPSGDPAQDQLDAGLFRQSASSDAVGMEVDATVVWPEKHRGQRIWGDTFWTVSGGDVDAKG